jgi:hypothetical protein
MCDHTSTIPQGFPGEMFFSAVPFFTHAMPCLILVSLKKANIPSPIGDPFPFHSARLLYARKARVTVCRPHIRGAHLHGYCLCLTWLPPTSNTDAQSSATS